MQTDWLVVGLGNPGRKYEPTRHNIGFMVVDALAARLGATAWRDEQRAAVARVRVDDHTLVLAKPQTFMNESGQSVRSLAAYYKIVPAQILVVADDLDLPFGRLRLRPHGSPGGHNGLRSIINQLGTQEFPRLRMGIGRPARGEPIDYVLSPFEPAERADLPHLCQIAGDTILQAVREGLLPAMNALNGRADVRDAVVAAGGKD